MTKDEALKLALEALGFALHVGFDESSASQSKKGEKAWLQHKKAITAIKQALNDATPLAAQPALKPLTDEQTYEAIGSAGNELLELAKMWSDNKIHVYQFDNEAQKIIKAVLFRAIEAAHGIKELT